MRNALLAALMVLCGCGQEAPPDAGPLDFAVAPRDYAFPLDLRPTPSGVGAPCASGSDCAGGQVCFDCTWAGGYCSRGCSDTDPCPADSACITFGGGGRFCMVRCQEDLDCRPDYFCRQSDHVCASDDLGQPPPASGPDGGACVTPVVDPAQGPRGPFGASVQVSQSAQPYYEFECNVAQDPTGQQAVVAHMLALPTAPDKLATAASAASWRELLLPIDGAVDHNERQADPTVAVDPLGSFWVSWLGLDLPGKPTDTHVFVARSDDGGQSFGEAIEVTPAGEGIEPALIDKPWLAIDPASGTMYLAWSHFDQGAEIRLARSTDRGQSWAVQTIAAGGGFVNLPQVTPAGDGGAYVVWIHLGGNELGSTDNQVLLQRIAPDGTLAGASVQVNQSQDAPAFDDPSVATFGGNVYVGFISGMGCGVWDVRAAASLDGGATFQPSVKVNDDPSCATHFHHQLAVDGNGNVHAIWYDNRYLVGNVFYAESGPADAMNPLSFGSNAFVSDQSFPFNTSPSHPSWLGDYLGLTISGGNHIAAVWADPRSGFSHIRVAQGTLP